MNKETHKTEFKSEWRNEHLKVISAFANCHGGKLIIGINDRGKPVLLKNTRKLLEDIPNIIRNKLGIIPDVNLSEADNHEIILINIDPSSVPISYNGKYYVRSGSTVQELRGKELSEFLIKKSGGTWDDAVEEHTTINDIDKSTIEDFKRFAADRILAITIEKDIETILHKLNLLEKGRLKRAALLAFGKEPQRLYSQAIIKIGHFITDTEIRTTDIVKGNLIRQLENIIEILRTKYLQSNIKYEGIHRRDILEYPPEALREGIINALIHRDYQSTSNIQIRIYKDKLIIMNEGSLPPEIPAESLKTNHLSKPRNKLLAGIFYYAGFIEAWGRGTLKIVEKCLEQGLPEPDFIEENGVMQVVFYKDKWTEDFLRKSGLNKRQIKAVKYLKEKGKITNNLYREEFNVSRATATRDLNDLVNKEILIQHGETGKGTFYILKAS